MNISRKQILFRNYSIFSSLANGYAITFSFFVTSLYITKKTTIIHFHILSLATKSPQIRRQLTSYCVTYLPNVFYYI